MTLSQEDGQLFYRLWLPLLDYVNERYHVCKDLKDMATAKGLDPAEVKKVANQLWENVEDVYKRQIVFRAGPVLPVLSVL